MTRDQHELESTYAVEDDAELPVLERLPDVAAVYGGEVDELEATYFDTATLALATAGITLRRRTGGSDAGWHLKLPLRQERFEIHEPLSRAGKAVPTALRTLLIAHTRNRDLRPVATVHTHRRVYTLLDDGGTTLAEFCDDRVRGKMVAEPDSVAWREWEVELVDGDAAFLARVASALEAAGGRPSDMNKLARTLGDRMPGRPEQTTAEASRTSPASQVVQERLLDQISMIRGYDPLVRRDSPGAVHKMRVAVRRLRAALATYRPLLARQQTDPIRDELKWLATALGESRDAEVLRERLTEKFAGEPPEVVRGASHLRMERELSEEYGRARAGMLGALSSDRYFALLDVLHDLAAEPPWSDKAAEPVHDVLRARVRHDYKRLVGRIEHAEEAEGRVEREHRLHEARKAAKRVRYAAEPVVGVYGKNARRFVRVMKRVQSRLGEHHDAVVAQERLRELAEAAARGEDAFIFGVLHAREERAAVEAHTQFVHEWRKASKKKRRRWLRRRD